MADGTVEGDGLRTPWRREFATPVRAFLKTESGTAGILVGGDRGRAGLGEPRRQLRTAVDDAVRPPARRPQHHPRPADVGQQRADDVLLPGRRAGGPARDRPRRPARPQPLPAARGGRAVRHGGAGRALPRGQRRGRRRRRLGRRHVDRYRAGAGTPRDGRVRRPRPGAHVPADRVRGRRHRGAAGDRGDLHRRGPCRVPGPGGRCCSAGSCWRSASGSGRHRVRVRGRRSGAASSPAESTPWCPGSPSG